MIFKLLFTKQSTKQYLGLKNNPANQKVYKAIKKSFELMKINLKHKSLNTHEYSSLSQKYGEKVFESYAQNRTPGAYRIFWIYGPSKGEITIIQITPHP